MPDRESSASAIRRLKLLSLDDDPIFRLGLSRVFLEQFPDLQIVAEAEISSALKILEINLPSIDLVILDPGLSRLYSSSMAGLVLCQHLKARYPHLPVLLLSASLDSEELAAARQAGVEGFCPKGTAISDLVEVIRRVAGGEIYWSDVVGAKLPDDNFWVSRQNYSLFPVGESTGESKSITPPPQPFTIFFDRLRLSGLRQIEAALAEVTLELQNARLSAVDQAILAGRRRELLASRWLVNWLLAPRVTATPAVLGESDRAGETEEPKPKALSRSIARPPLFESTFAQLQYNLRNLTDTPLEIDIFREEKKRELLHLILHKVEELLDELRFSQVLLEQLPQKHYTLLHDLWQAAITDFFGKYYTLTIDNRQVEVVNVLLQDAAIVKTAILNKLPQFVELFSHLLFEIPLVIDNTLYALGTPEARLRSEFLLQNLIIQVANAVVQPLLNHFADIESIKQDFYDRRLISTREIEKFRNNLSWKYRLEKYIDEPMAIFESRYILFILDEGGIRKLSIYAPRVQELNRLSGIQLWVTLILETRDAIVPRLRATVALVGRGIVYILTHIIGRGIGLIGRGILQGIQKF